MFGIHDGTLVNPNAGDFRAPRVKRQDYGQVQNPDEAPRIGA